MCKTKYNSILTLAELLFLELLSRYVALQNWTSRTSAKRDSNKNQEVSEKGGKGGKNIVEQKTARRQ